MSRLTRKNNQGGSWTQSGDKYIPAHNIKHKQCVNKLGKLEDLEEQLGCPLDVVFKALKTNVWNDKTKRQEWVVLDYSNGEFVLKSTKELYVDDNKSILPLKDYGITWWLKGNKGNES